MFLIKMENEMKNRNQFLSMMALTLTLALGTSDAHASMKAAAYSMVTENALMEEQFAEMGYRDAEEVAEAFEDAEGAAMSNLSSKTWEELKKGNWGSLAICAKASAQYYLGADVAICSTLFNAYSVVALNAGMGGSATAGVEAIYFATGARDQKSNYCYVGGAFEVAIEGGGGARAMKEVRCPNESDSIEYMGCGGFFVGFSIVAGVSGHYSATGAMVSHLKSYW